MMILVRYHRQKVSEHTSTRVRSVSECSLGHKVLEELGDAMTNAHVVKLFGQ